MNKTIVLAETDKEHDVELFLREYVSADKRPAVYVYDSHGLLGSPRDFARELASEWLPRVNGRGPR